MDFISQTGQFLGVAGGMAVVASWQIIGRSRILVATQALAGALFAASYLLIGNISATFAAAPLPAAFLWGLLAPAGRGTDEDGSLVHRCALLAGLGFAASCLWLLTSRGNEHAWVQFSSSYVALGAYLLLLRRGETALRLGMPVCACFWLVNNLATPSIGGIVLNVIELVSMAIAWFRIALPPPPPLDSRS